MQWTFSNNGVPEQTTATVELGDTTYGTASGATGTAIQVGDWVYWDFTNNTAQAGVMAETRGARVKKLLVALNQINYVAGCVLTLPPIQGTITPSTGNALNLATSARVGVFQIVTYGFHPTAHVDIVDGTEAAGTTLCAAGTAEGSVREMAATGDEEVQLCGILGASQGTTAARVPVFVRCI